MTAGATTTDDDVAAAVQELLTVAKGDPLAGDVPPGLARLADADVSAALRLQLAVLAAWEGEGERLGGWKIGLTSRVARDAMGLGVRPHGYVLDSRILDSGATLTATVPNCRLEPEVGVTMGADLAGPDVTVEQARAAVASVHPAFEINSNRVPKGSSYAVRLGNALNNWGIVLGPAHDPDGIDLLALSVEIGNEDGVIDSGGSGAVLDDPYLSLTRVCAALATNGRGLSAGQRLITGSITGAVATDRGHHYYGDFGPLGRVELEIA